MVETSQPHLHAMSTITCASVFSQRFQHYCEPATDTHDQTKPLTTSRSKSGVARGSFELCEGRNVQYMERTATPQPSQPSQCSIVFDPLLRSSTRIAPMHCHQSISLPEVNDADASTGHPLAHLPSSLHPRCLPALCPSEGWQPWQLRSWPHVPPWSWSPS